MAGSVVLLSWGFWPGGRTVQVLRLDSPLMIPDATNGEVGHPVSALRLEYPEKVRLNDRAMVRLAFEVQPEEGAFVAGSENTERSTTASSQPIAEARLEIPGALVRPPDSIHEALAGGNPLDFYWTVVLRTAGEYNGTAWSFLTLQAGPSMPATRIALGAQNVTMQGITLLGMGGEATRIVGGLSLIGGLVLGLPFVEPAARWASRRVDRGV